MFLDSPFASFREQSTYCFSFNLFPFSTLILLTASLGADRAQQVRRVGRKGNWHCRAAVVKTVTISNAMSCYSWV